MIFDQILTVCFFFEVFCKIFTFAQSSISCKSVVHLGLITSAHYLADFINLGNSVDARLLFILTRFTSADFGVNFYSRL